MTENTDGAVEIVILLTGGAGSVIDEVPAAHQLDVGTRICNVMKESRANPNRQDTSNTETT
jgi:hypothetical protein